MAAPTVHLLSSASFNAVAIPDAISAQLDESGSPQEYVSADSPNVKLVAVDRIAATLVITTLSYGATPAVGDTGAVALAVKPRVEGKGVGGTAVTISYTNGVVVSKGSGPTIEGSPSYTITIRCHAAP
jgi:hypothetical protein